MIELVIFNEHPVPVTVCGYEIAPGCFEAFAVDGFDESDEITLHHLDKLPEVAPVFLAQAPRHDLRLRPEEASEQ